MTAVTPGRDAIQSLLDLFESDIDQIDVTPRRREVITYALRLADKPDDEGVSIFMPPDGDVTALGKEYLERRVSSMTEAVDREQWRQEDGEAGRPEYWIGRLHEAKIALSNLTQGLERRGDGFGRASTTGAPKP